MRIEQWLILITGAILFHMYTDGKYTKNLMMYKKYYQMAGVVFGAFVLYILLKKNPANARNILVTSNEYLKYLPVDKNTSSMLSPILDFTSKHSFQNQVPFLLRDWRKVVEHPDHKIVQQHQYVLYQEHP